MNARLKELPDRGPSSAYDSVRREELRRKHAPDPEPEFLDEKDAAAYDAGVPRFGPI